MVLVCFQFVPIINVTPLFLCIIPSLFALYTVSQVEDTNQGCVCLSLQQFILYSI